MIGRFTLGGNSQLRLRVAVRALGPSAKQFRHRRRRRIRLLDLQQRELFVMISTRLASDPVSPAC